MKGIHSDDVTTMLETLGNHLQCIDSPKYAHLITMIILLDIDIDISNAHIDSPQTQLSCLRDRFRAYFIHKSTLVVGHHLAKVALNQLIRHTLSEDG